MKNLLAKLLLACLLTPSCQCFALEPAPEPTPEIVDPTKLKLPDGLLEKYLNYPAVGEDESKPDNWKLIDAYLADLEGVSQRQLVVTARGYHGDWPSIAGVFVFDKYKPNDGWRLIGFKSSGEYSSVDFMNLDGRPGLEIILNGGIGNHGKYFQILAVRKSTLVSLCDFEGYSWGERVAVIGGKPRVINYRQELPDACEGCQSYYPDIADFNGNSFVAKNDDFVECLSKDGWEKGKESEIADCFLSVLHNRPNLFGALVQAEYFTRKAGRTEEADRLVERIKALKSEDLTYPGEPAPGHENKLKYLREKGWMK